MKNEIIPKNNLIGHEPSPIKINQQATTFPQLETEDVIESEDESCVELNYDNRDMIEMEEFEDDKEEDEDDFVEDEEDVMEDEKLEIFEKINYPYPNKRNNKSVPKSVTVGFGKLVEVLKSVPCSHCEIEQVLVNVINGVKYSTFCRTSINSKIEQHRYRKIKEIIYKINEKVTLEDFEKRINEIILEFERTGKKVALGADGSWGTQRGSPVFKLVIMNVESGEIIWIETIIKKEFGKDGKHLYTGNSSNMEGDALQLSLEFLHHKGLLRFVDEFIIDEKSENNLILQNFFNLHKYKVEIKNDLAHVVVNIGKSKSFKNLNTELKEKIKKWFTLVITLVNKLKISKNEKYIEVERRLKCSKNHYLGRCDIDCPCNKKPPDPILKDEEIKYFDEVIEIMINKSLHLISKGSTSQIESTNSFFVAVHGKNSDSVRAENWKYKVLMSGLLWNIGFGGVLKIMKKKLCLSDNNHTLKVYEQYDKIKNKSHERYQLNKVIYNKNISISKKERKKIEKEDSSKRESKSLNLNGVEDWLDESSLNNMNKSQVVQCASKLDLKTTKIKIRQLKSRILEFKNNNFILPIKTWKKGSRERQPTKTSSKKQSHPSSKPLKKISKTAPKKQSKPSLKSPKKLPPKQIENYDYSEIDSEEGLVIVETTKNKKITLFSVKDKPEDKFEKLLKFYHEKDKYKLKGIKIVDFLKIYVEKKIDYVDLFASIQLKIFTKIEKKVPFKLVPSTETSLAKSSQILSNTIKNLRNNNLLVIYSLSEEKTDVFVFFDFKNDSFFFISTKEMRHEIQKMIKDQFQSLFKQESKFYFYFNNKMEQKQSSVNLSWYLYNLFQCKTIFAKKGYLHDLIINNDTAKEKDIEKIDDTLHEFFHSYLAKREGVSGHVRAEQKRTKQNEVSIFLPPVCLFCQCIDDFRDKCSCKGILVCFYCKKVSSLSNWSPTSHHLYPHVFKKSVFLLLLALKGFEKLFGGLKLPKVLQKYFIFFLWKLFRLKLFSFVVF
eukprot:TRINITY_DN4980_c0_g1_i2.p1 TRINITY_DN4980_c0_g1~~TRINITY_DN4980_c0_g1_i2.p1  ORF type:complete len:1002 (+),score=244.16 TRINITY_DN4980_c0_g1_i2:605-3610(+)